MSPPALSGRLNEFTIRAWSFCVDYASKFRRSMRRGSYGVSAKDIVCGTVGEKEKGRCRIKETGRNLPELL
jgi:hypothetical protein